MIGRSPEAGVATLISRNENWIAEAPADAQQFIRQHGAVSTFCAGEEISPADAECAAVYQVREGYVKLVRGHRSGEASMLAVFGPGNTWGEAPILARRRTRHATVALTDCQIMSLHREAFLQLYSGFRDVPNFLCLHFARSQSRRTRTYPLPASEKVGATLARALCDCIEDLPRGADANVCEIDFPLTQGDLAGHLGVTRQSIHRELSVMRAAGVIDRSNEHWIIRDVRRLRRIAQSETVAVTAGL
jgi:CRP-like cAMP-binding protein